MFANEKFERVLYLRGMKYFTLLYLLLACWACQSEPAPERGEVQTEPMDTTITQEAAEAFGPEDRTYVPGVRLGMITANTTPEQLIEYYGEDNIREDSIPLGKGYFLSGYKLFPGQSSEVSIVYPDKNRYVKELQVTIDEQGTDWKSAQNGIGVGTTLGELERANGRAFTFFGFDWDYGGVVTDWQDGGALSDHRIRLAYAMDGGKRPELHPTLLGEQKVTTTSPYLADLGIAVKQIIVRLPR